MMVTAGSVAKNQLYVLKCESGKWYIGVSANVYKRFEQHHSGNGAKWTELHRPIEIHAIFAIKGDADDLVNVGVEEDALTLEYMRKYGIDNVRGGSFCAVEFRSWNIKEIQAKLDSVFPIQNIPIGVMKEENVRKVGSNKRCSRCGRNNHTVEKCYAKTRIYGKNIESLSTQVLFTEAPSVITFKMPVLNWFNTDKKAVVPSAEDPIPPVSSTPATTPTEEVSKKIVNEFLNPNSDLRSGRWFKKVFGF